MKQKDLAEEYLTKAKENAIYFKDGNFPNMPLYQEKDINAAFNAGRESVFDSFPRLLFKETREELIADNGGDYCGQRNIENVECEGEYPNEMVILS